MNLLSKLSKLKELFFNGDPQDVDAIDSWVNEAKRLMLLKSLFEHDGVKYVYEIFNSEIIKINEALLKSDSKSLSDKERDRLIDRRDLAQKYVNLFTNLDEQVEKLEELVDNESISGV